MYKLHGVYSTWTVATTREGPPEALVAAGVLQAVLVGLILAEQVAILQEGLSIGVGLMFLVVARVVWDTLVVEEAVVCCMIVPLAICGLVVAEEEELPMLEVFQVVIYLTPLLMMPV